MGLRAYIAKRIAYSFVLLMFVITLNFIIFFMMPGDPASMWINPTGRLTQEEIEKQKELIKQRWGLGEPQHIIFLRTTISLLTFNFGKSIVYGRPIVEMMLEKIPFTLFILGTSTIISIVIGVLLGVLSAYKRGGKLDSGLVTSSLILYSLPTFWMGLVLIFIFTSTLHWLPHAGTVPFEWAQRRPVPYTIQTDTSSTALGIQFALNPTGALQFVGGYLRHAVLPILTLTLFSYGGYLLLTRATMLEVLTEDYIVTARAKGVSERTVLLRHALKNASLPLITSAALSFGFILSGAIITETVYGYEGLGHWIWSGILARDYPVVLPIFYVIAICVIAANFIADLLYGIIDPRIKYA